MLTVLDGRGLRRARQARWGWNESALNLFWGGTKSLWR